MKMWLTYERNCRRRYYLNIVCWKYTRFLKNYCPIYFWNFSASQKVTEKTKDIFIILMNRATGKCQSFSLHHFKKMRSLKNKLSIVFQISCIVPWRLRGPRSKMGYNLMEAVSSYISIKTQSFCFILIKVQNNILWYWRGKYCEQFPSPS